jgi:hypothetical protein
MQACRFFLQHPAPQVLFKPQVVELKQEFNLARHLLGWYQMVSPAGAQPVRRDKC